MDCSRITSLFSAGLEQELAEVEQEAFDHHLESCPGCQRQWRLFQATVARVRELEPLSPPLGILSGIQAGLEQPSPPTFAARLLAGWRRLNFSVSMPTAVATVALAMIMAFLAKEETFFQYQPTPAAERVASQTTVAPDSRGYRLPLPDVTLASTSPRHSFDTVPTHSPAIRVPVLQRPDVLMVLHAAPPEMFPHLFHECATLADWQVEYPEPGLLIFELPAGDLADLRNMLVPYPVTVAPVAALSPNFAPRSSRLRVAVRAH